LRPGIDPAHLILALFQAYVAKFMWPIQAAELQAAKPGEFFKTTESHYSHAQRVDASRHITACSASNVP
jgi:hypothetical protein